ncbi:zinc finger protein ZFP2-like isoform X2 [Sitodiplosis mosellana]|uniref:zinc finger protein ZFP2-like isoform X2 n=1 Tax=Sitodiplosis mosellana TaxID=263140 RepID=UPI002444A0C5|nr:zinc finger protein ZFP2-like isoform X2 [Sitodiplosis mosellana]
MSVTKAVHECLFCPQTFGSATEKDDHILEHFAQETCTDCDQSLLRIGSNLYTLHNTVTCIKRESKPDVRIQHDKYKGSINQNCDEWNYNATAAICDQQLDIKLEPRMEQNEQLMSPINFAETSSIENYQGSNNQNSIENISAIDVTLSNTVSVGEIEIKMEPEAQGKFSEEQSKSNYKYKCDVCLKLFKWSSQLKHHKKFRHPAPGTQIDRIQCEICKTFVRADTIRNHMKKQHSNCIKYNCEFCWGKFLSKKSLDKHVPRCKRPKQKQSSYMSGKPDEKEQSKRNYKYNRAPCDICGELFYTFWMDRHKKLKHSSNDFDQYQCDICKRFIRKKESLLRHMNIKHDRTRLWTTCPKFKCDYCSKNFAAKNSLDNHLNHCNRKKKSFNESPLTNESISTEKLYMCDICGDKFTKPNGVRIHQYAVHKTGGYKCGDCKLVFFTAQGLTNHGPKCRKLSTRTFECYMCHKKISSKMSLLSHILRKHDRGDMWKYGCETCGKRFVSKSECKSHNNIAHLKLSAVRNFLCATCGRACPDRYRLKQHEMIHTGEKPLKCSIEGCDQYFRYSTSLMLHLKNHRGEKRYQCKINGCTEQFGGVRGYKKHQLNVHGISMTKKK